MTSRGASLAGSTACLTAMVNMYRWGGLRRDPPRCGARALKTSRSHGPACGAACVAVADIESERQGQRQDLSCSTAATRCQGAALVPLIPFCVLDQDTGKHHQVTKVQPDCRAGVHHTDTGSWHLCTAGAMICTKCCRVPGCQGEERPDSAQQFAVSPASLSRTAKMQIRGLLF